MKNHVEKINIRFDVNSISKMLKRKDVITFKQFVIGAQQFVIRMFE